MCRGALKEQASDMTFPAVSPGHLPNFCQPNLLKWAICTVFLLLHQYRKLLIHEVQCLLLRLNCAAKQNNSGYPANNAADRRTAAYFVEATCMESCFTHLRMLARTALFCL